MLFIWLLFYTYSIKNEQLNCQKIQAFLTLTLFLLKWFREFYIMSEIIWILPFPHPNIYLFWGRRLFSEKNANKDFPSSSWKLITSVPNRVGDSSESKASFIYIMLLEYQCSLSSNAKVILHIMLLKSLKPWSGFSRGGYGGSCALISQLFITWKFTVFSVPVAWYEIESTALPPSTLKSFVSCTGAALLTSVRLV